jgi:hypothetical protein
MKKFFKMGCFGFIGLIVLGIIISSFSGGDEETTSTSEADTKTEVKDDTKKEAKKETKEEVKVAGIGEVVKVGDVEFTVNGVETATNVGGEFGQDAQGKFLLVDVTVKNVGNEAITTDASFFKLKAGEKTFEADSTAGIYANDNTEFFLQQINPDLENNGTVVFDVSEEVISNPDLLLNVQTGFFGTEQGSIKIAQ